MNWEERHLKRGNLTKIRKNIAGAAKPQYSYKAPGYGTSYGTSFPGMMIKDIL